MATDEQVFRGLPFMRPPRPPVVQLTLWRPGAVLPPAAPMPIDPYADDERLGFKPVPG